MRKFEYFLIFLYNKTYKEMIYKGGKKYVWNNRVYR